MRGYKMVIHAKFQPFPLINGRELSLGAALYSLLKTGRFELFLGWLPPKMGGRVGGVNVARKTWPLWVWGWDWGWSQDRGWGGRAVRESSQRQRSVTIGKLNIEKLNEFEHWKIEQIWTLNKLNKVEHWTNWTNLNSWTWRREGLWGLWMGHFHSVQVSLTHFRTQFFRPMQCCNRLGDALGRFLSTCSFQKSPWKVRSEVWSRSCGHSKLSQNL